ncbi:MAG: radical SAM protein [Syntrophaceae bacterium]|nr:MAG: radical SAM protein [Syntrophaceae bacterium]
MKKITLKLISIHIKDSPQAVPLAAASLKAQLDSVPSNSLRVDVSFHDYTVDNSADLIEEDICRNIPDMIGFSMYLWNRHLVIETCRIIKAKFPAVLLFAGGPEATALPLILLDCAPFDFVIKGEGEIVLTEVMNRLLKGDTLEDIPGVFLNGAKADSGKNQQPVMDLNTLPSPFLTGTIDPSRYSGLLWELSRGCPFKCGFCFESRGVAGVRQISLERIRKELELFEEKKVTQVFVLDPTFNSDMKRAKKILRMILKTAPLIHFTFEIRAEFIDREIAGLFAGIHCSLQVGLESAVREVLANVNRTLDTVKYAEKIALLNSAGVIFGLDLIYGLPGDTPDGFKESLNYALGLQPNHLDIFPLAVIPGTALYDQAESFLLNSLQDAPYTLISSPGFSESAMAEAERLKNACEIFYNRGGAAGWMFMALETLNLAPSEFLSDFAVYLSSCEQPLKITRAEITVMQSSFVKEQFTKQQRKNLFPVMEDIITIHGALNRSLYAGPLVTAGSNRFNDETVFCLSPGTISLSLKYDFDELMTVGELTFEEFLEHYSTQKTYLVIYNCGGAVKTLTIDRTLSRLLDSFTGIASPKAVCEKENIKARKKIYEFLEFAVEEQMIHPI